MKIQQFKEQIEKTAAEANFCLRPDVGKLLKQACVAEKNKRARKALGWILQNARIAKRESLAICQDTGLPIVFVEAGKDIKVDAALVNLITQAVEAGYRKNYLRPSLTDPLIRKPSYKTALCHIDFSHQRGLKITLFPKGFGSENKSALKMFNPTVSFDDIAQFVIASVRKAGPESCPPFVVGVGIGATADGTLLLAKKALLEKIDRPNKDKVLQQLEKKWLKQINALGIGPMGLGGKCTALAVKIKTAPTHIAGLPVGVNISCHALRSATLKIDSLIRRK